MKFELHVKNYRSFSSDEPAVIWMERGISALIGANNAGKSTLLRFFYELRPLFEELCRADAWERSLEEPQPLPEFCSPFVDMLHKHDGGDMVISIRPDVEIGDSKDGPVPEHVDVVLLRKSMRWITRIDGVHGNASCEGGERAVLLVDGRELAAWRWMEMIFRRMTSTFYTSPLQALGGSGFSGRHFDLRVGDDFLHMWWDHQRGHPGLAMKQKGQLEEEMRRMFRLDEFSVVTQDEDGPLRFKLNGETMPADELGSAIGKAFLIFAQAMILHPEFILIDEPEAHLHPAMQADFVTALNGHARRGLIMATHHMGLARSVADRIYEVHKPAGRKHTRIVPFIGNERLSEALGEMSFSAQQTMGCQKILLVEGPTEVKALRQWLRQMGAERQVVIVPLGGSSMINAHRAEELAEICRICPDIYALIDSEAAGPQEPLGAEREGFLRSCRKVGIVSHVLQRRSLENYFTDHAVKAVMGPRYHALGPHDDIKKVFSRWPKSDNWKVVAQMRWEDVASTDLGLFLKKVASAPCRKP